MWTSKEFGLDEADVLCLEQDAWVKELAASMAACERGEGQFQAVWFRETYQVGSCVVSFYGERSGVSGTVQWTRCELKAAAVSLLPSLEVGDLEIQDFYGQWHRVTGRVEAAYRLQAQQGARGLVGRAFRSDSERRAR